MFLAKTASDMQKPDGLVWLDAEQPGPEFFALELRDLCGIGRNMHDRLQSRGIFTVRGLWEASPKRLGKVWGGIEGERFWQGLHGIEPVRPETTPRQVGHSKILPPELRNENGSRAMLDRLVYKAVMRLRRQGHECGEMRIYVRMSHHGGISWSGVARFPSTQEVLPLMEVWRELWQERPSPLSCPFMVGVDLTMLLPHDDPRLPLFAPCARDQAVSCLLEEIARKHGAKSLWFGSAHEAVAEDAPRVAFFTLPDT